MSIEAVLRGEKNGHQETCVCQRDVVFEAALPDGQAFTKWDCTAPKRFRRTRAHV